MFADARRSERKQVIILVANADAKAQGGKRTLLPDDAIERRELSRALEVDLLGIAAAVERLRRQGFSRCHGDSRSSSAFRDPAVTGLAVLPLYGTPGDPMRDLLMRRVVGILQPGMVEGLAIDRLGMLRQMVRD
jgi:hypothetical protein